jgi:carbamoyl-phosphate synthase large subunit
MEEGKIDLVINIPKNNEKMELDSDYFIRRKAIDLNIPLITNIQVAKRFVKAIYYSKDKLEVKSWSEYK